VGDAVAVGEGCISSDAVGVGRGSAAQAASKITTLNIKIFLFIFCILLIYGAGMTRSLSPVVMK